MREARIGLRISPWWWLGAVFTAGCAYALADDVADRLTRAQVAMAMTGGNPSYAPQNFRKYGCSGCHTIPGVPGADGQVGGALAGLSGRVYIGGVLTNSPDHLIAWIVTPERFSPNTAMPVTGITETEARDIAAYLYHH
jgi:cytochrome c2